MKYQTLRYYCYSCDRVYASVGREPVCIHCGSVNVDRIYRKW